MYNDRVLRIERMQRDWNALRRRHCRFHIQPQLLYFCNELPENVLSAVDDCPYAAPAMITPMPNPSSFIICSLAQLYWLRAQG